MAHSLCVSSYPGVSLTRLKKKKITKTKKKKTILKQNSRRIARPFEELCAILPRHCWIRMSYSFHSLSVIWVFRTTKRIPRSRAQVPSPRRPPAGHPPTGVRYVTERNRRPQTFRTFALASSTRTSCRSMTPNFRSPKSQCTARGRPTLGCHRAHS